MEGGLGLEMRLRLKGPYIDNRATTTKNQYAQTQMPGLLAVRYLLRRPLADGIQSLPLAPHVLRIRLVWLLGVIESTIAITGLIRIVVEQTRRLRL